MRTIIRKIVAYIFYPFYLFSLRVFSPIARDIRILHFQKRLGHCGKRAMLYGKNNSFQNLKDVSIGDDFAAGDELRIHAIKSDEYSNDRYKIVIGNGVHFSFRCQIDALNRVVIGDGALIGSNVLITDNSHGETCALGVSRCGMFTSRGGVAIGKNVWIGNNVCILSGVTIGDNCIVGAGSIVTKSFTDSNLVLAGVPAKIIKHMEKRQ